MMMGTEKLSGQISISKTTSPDGDEISIEIEDKKSGISVVRLRMSLEDFAQAITGRSCSPCLLDITNPEYLFNLGKDKEVKDILLNGRFSKYDNTQGILDDAIKPHLIDGWMLWNSGLTSQQNTAGKHRITLYRYTTPPAQEKN